MRDTFVQLYDEGLIYRGKRLVNWDPKLHTAISDLEGDTHLVGGEEPVPGLVEGQCPSRQRRLGGNEKHERDCSEVSHNANR